MHPTLVRRPGVTGPKLTQDITRHLQVRCSVGTSVIIAEKPISFLSTLRKQWIKMERQLQRDRASTINPEKIIALTTMLANMYSVKFSASPTWNLADVYVQAPTFTTFNEPVKTVYICTPLSHEQRLNIRHAIDEDALIIDFTRQPLP